MNDYENHLTTDQTWGFLLEGRCFQPPKPMGLDMSALMLHADPVHQAWNRLWAAGEDDAAYEKARHEVEVGIAGSVPGLQAQVALAHAAVLAASEGDGVNLKTLLALLERIQRGLAAISGQRVRPLE